MKVKVFNKPNVKMENNEERYKSKEIINEQNEQNETEQINQVIIDINNIDNNNFNEKEFLNELVKNENINKIKYVKHTEQEQESKYKEHLHLNIHLNKELHTNTIYSIINNILNKGQKMEKIIGLVNESNNITNNELKNEIINIDTNNYYVLNKKMIMVNDSKKTGIGNIENLKEHLNNNNINKNIVLENEFNIVLEENINNNDIENLKETFTKSFKNFLDNLNIDIDNNYKQKLLDNIKNNVKVSNNTIKFNVFSFVKTTDNKVVFIPKSLYSNKLFSILKQEIKKIKINVLNSKFMSFSEYNNFKNYLKEKEQEKENKELQKQEQKENIEITDENLKNKVEKIDNEIKTLENLEYIDNNTKQQILKELETKKTDYYNKYLEKLEQQKKQK